MINKEELDQLINDIQFLATGGTLEVAEIEGNTVKIKLVCPDIGTFKVKGKIVDTTAEIKGKVEKYIKDAFPEAEVVFV